MSLRPASAGFMTHQIPGIAPTSTHWKLEVMNSPWGPRFKLPSGSRQPAMAACVHTALAQKRNRGRAQLATSNRPGRMGQWAGRRPAPGEWGRACQCAHAAPAGAGHTSIQVIPSLRLRSPKDKLLTRISQTRPPFHALIPLDITMQFRYSNRHRRQTLIFHARWRCASMRSELRGAYTREAFRPRHDRQAQSETLLCYPVEDPCLLVHCCSEADLYRTMLMGLKAHVG